MFYAVRHRGGIRKVLEGLAIIAVARQERSRALRLGGAAAALWGTYHDDWRRRRVSFELERALARARAEEGPPAAAAWLEGWNRPLDETIAYALGDPSTL
jgi:hypothetical protein